MPATDYQPPVAQILSDGRPKVLIASNGSIMRTGRASKIKDSFESIEAATIEQRRSPAPITSV